MGTSLISFNSLLVTCPYTSDDESIVGNIAVGILVLASMSLSHCNVLMFINSVLDAFVTSVACTAPE